MSTRTLQIGPQALWIKTPDGLDIDLGSHRRLRDMAWALVQRHLTDPEVPISLNEIREAVWPGEKMLETSARNRVYVAISNLRKMGIGEMLQRKDDGYALDPDLTLEVSSEQEAPEASEQVPTRDRIRARRQKYFSGRGPELAVFGRVLQDTAGPQVVFLAGEGGVGKSTLARAFSDLAEERGLPTLRLDCRLMDPSPQSVNLAYRSHPDSEAYSKRSQRWILHLDTYERLQNLDFWVRETFATELPDSCLLLISGRVDQSEDWVVDPAWVTATTSIALKPFDKQEAEEFLTARGVSEDEQQEMIAWTGGLPLAIAMAVETNAKGAGEDGERSVLGRLVNLYIDEAPTKRHRDALEVLAILNYTTEDVLWELMGDPGTYDLIEWLRARSFVDQGRRGLYPHDLARESLKANLSWRNPTRYTELHQRAFNFCAETLRANPGSHQIAEIARDVVSLFSNGPLYGQLAVRTDGWPEAGTEADYPAVCETLRWFKMPETEEALLGWFERQPDGLQVFRLKADLNAGFMFCVTIDPEWCGDPDLAPPDPALRALLPNIPAESFQNEGDVVLFVRLWRGGRVDNQSQSPAVPLVMSGHVRLFFTPGLTQSYIVHENPEQWDPIQEYSFFGRVAGSEFEMDGRRFAAYGHNWREQPAIDYLVALADRINSGA